VKWGFWQCEDVTMEEKTTRFEMQDEKLLFQILRAIKSIRYGYIQIVVQDSKVVQIDKTEKLRFDKEDFCIE
jgi:hypothetical protein